MPLLQGAPPLPLPSATPFCPYFAVCGGCDTQDLAYADQVAWKDRWLRMLFAEFAELEWKPFLASPDSCPTYFRNKIRFSFVVTDGIVSPSRHAQAPGLTDIPVEACFLQSPQAMAYARDTAVFATMHGWKPYDPATQSGWLKHILIRESQATGQALLALVIGDYAPESEIQEWALWMKARHAGLTSLYQSYTKGRSADTLTDTLLWGKPVIQDKVGEYRFQISPHAFFQTNAQMIGVLYDAIAQAAQLTQDDTLWDLYAGSATIGIWLANQAGQVVSIESNPQNIRDAQRNRELNSVSNLEIYEGTVESVLTEEFLDTCHKPTVLVIDPPRSGLSPQMRAVLPGLGAKRIAYASCNPATLLRDSRALQSAGYSLISIQGVDMFPHALHFEAVICFEKP